MLQGKPKLVINILAEVAGLPACIQQALAMQQGHCPLQLLASPADCSNGRSMWWRDGLACQ